MTDPEGAAGKILDRVYRVLHPVLPVTREADGALTADYEGTLTSIRAVTIATGLDVVSLSQVLAWDVAVNAKSRHLVDGLAQKSLFGNILLIAKGRKADVLLRYNFPATGIDDDDALVTLLMMVFATGADARKALGN
ncbi:Uncharacterised protein [Mycobacteroides abscessus subsp. abscessus]|uniref:Uncharacterized protein n=6 Tax=Mycobacteroides abscessus TaxID=36809 RepID=B1MN50_MYCA9|nr:hypothetical protein [Mycobacteroides abscessus]ALM16158.1 hypothetical protein AOY11_07750 [Mycobacteroides abscessus]AMU45247.1 hypothetical protein A3O00_08380 [Mycobacteroides abscessus]AMU50220.1 hypothetical protein A3O01_08780 [Mycobacteroides abscessus]AMU55219.1 hypothetical protein A3O02_08615 [Mycobacteroides abscessus]ANO08898.1 hypothetical protein BAB76_08790 [Mycobacteroides abscessus]